jgi:hypothetical protein
VAVGEEGDDEDDDDAPPSGARAPHHAPPAATGGAGYHGAGTAAAAAPQHDGGGGGGHILLPPTMSKKQVQKAEKKKTAQQQREYYEYMNAERKKKEEGKRAKEQELEQERERLWQEKQRLQNATTTSPATTAVPVPVVDKEPTDSELISKLLSLRAASNSTTTDVIRDVVRISSLANYYFPVYTTTAPKRSLRERLKALPQPLSSSANCSVWWIDENDDNEFLLVSDAALLRLADHVREKETVSLHEATEYLQKML